MIVALIKIPAGTISINSVEYPDVNDLPSHLNQREITHPHFWQKGGFYAFAPATTDTSIATLYISEKPSTGEDAVVECNDIGALQVHIRGSVQHQRNRSGSWRLMLDRNNAKIGL